MHIILFYGLRRSGNHAILNLFIKGYKNYVHINDVKELDYEEFNKNAMIPITVTDIDRKYTGFLKTDLVIISMENKLPNYDVINKIQESYENVYVFMLLRNPINHLSSAWTEYKNNKKNIFNEIKKLWIEYSKIIIKNDNKINYIIYDKFYSNEDYRINILKKNKY